MENLQAAATVAPIAPPSPAASTAAANDAPGESAVLPWAAALQAALTQHGKPQKPLPTPGAAGVDPAAPTDAVAPDSDDKSATTVAPLAAVPTDLPLPLLIAVAPNVPAAAPTTGSAHAAAAPVPDTVLTAPAIAARTESAPVLDLPVSTGFETAKAPTASNPVARTDALVRAIEQAPAREMQDRTSPVQAALPPALTHAPTTAAPPPAQLQINAAVGSATWGMELGQSVVWMVGEKQQVAELRVNPPDLGPLDIKLTINAHETTAVFTSPHGAVRDAVESALPRLREVLAESGIMLGNASVTADSSRDGAAFAAAHEQARHGGTAARAPGSMVAPGATPPGHLVVRRGLVDLFA